MTDKEGEMVQALQSTLRILQAERSRQTAQAAQATQAQKRDRESSSPTEMKSPRARRRRSSAK